MYLQQRRVTIDVNQIAVALEHAQTSCQKRIEIRERKRPVRVKGRTVSAERLGEFGERNITETVPGHVQLPQSRVFLELLCKSNNETI